MAFLLARLDVLPRHDELPLFFSRNGAVAAVTTFPFFNFYLIKSVRALPSIFFYQKFNKIP